MLLVPQKPTGEVEDYVEGYRAAEYNAQVTALSHSFGFDSAILNEPACMMLA